MSVETKPVAPVKLTIKDYKSDLHNDWCPGCIAPESRIVMADGSSRRIADVVAGDLVLAHDGEAHTVLRATSHRHDDTLRRVAIAGHGDLLITRDHPMFIVRRESARARDATSRAEWVPAGDVQPGDYVAYPRPALVAAGVHGDGATYGLRSVGANEVVAYDAVVHNLEVEGAHSYLTVGATLHNCGDFGILTGVQMALAQLNLDPDKVACFSGIGCSGKTPHYVKAYGFHTLHGRVLPVATGGRLVNSAITVLAMGGDGDGYGIGAGYFVNSGRRNLDFTYIVHNNNVYGLTKGQPSPTLAKGKKTKSMPEQAIQDGINPIAMAVAAGYTFIARAYALEPKYLAGIIAKAILHRGSALVDVLQTCPTYNDLYTKEWYEGADLPEKKSRLYKLEEQGFDGIVADVTDTAEVITKKAAAVAKSYETEPIPIGIYYQAELPTYEDGVNARIPALADTPLVEIDTFHRDLTPLLDAMR
ncbi:MAG: thiamine pyrophosphate-dependent enzyme [Candidatus Limnocylindria bacterium]